MLEGVNAAVSDTAMWASGRAHRHAVVWNIVRDDRTGTHDRVGADPNSSRHRHVGRHPGVIPDLDAASALWAIGVDRVLVCVEDPAPGPHHGEGPYIDGLFRAQVATVQEGAPTEIHPGSIKNREMNRLQFASQPSALSDHQLASLSDTEADTVSASLGRNPSLDSDSSPRTQFETRQREIRTGGRMDLQARVATLEEREPPSIQALDEPENHSNNDGPHAGTIRGSGARRVLAFAQAERDESVGRIVWREAHRNPVPRNDADAKASHASGELGSDRLPRLERDLIATPAEDLVHGARRLNQIISRQVFSPRLPASLQRAAN